MFVQKLDTFRFKYQHVDCLYTSLKPRISDNLLSGKDKFLKLCREQSTLVEETGEWTESSASQNGDF